MEEVYNEGKINFALIENMTQELDKKYDPTK